MPAVVAAAAAGSLLIVVVGLYSQRGPIGTRLALDYLEKRGVPAQIRIERLGPEGFSGSAILGPANDPDLVIDHMDVEFEPFPMVRDASFMPRIRTIRLVRPRLKARWSGGKLTFGSMQRLVDEFLAQPATGPAPAVTIEGGVARIATSAGPLSLGGDGVMREGRIVRADIRMGPQRLAEAGRMVDIQSARLLLTGRGEQLGARLDAAIPQIAQPGLSARALTASLSAELPYGRNARQAFDGRLGVDGTLHAASLVAGDNRLQAPRLSVSFGGASKGPLDRLAVSGAGRVDFTGAAVDGAAALREPRLVATASNVRVARTETGDQFALSLDVSGAAERMGAGAATLTGVTLRGDSRRLEGVLSDQGLSMRATPTLALTAQSVDSGTVRGRGLDARVQSPSVTVSSAGDGWRILAPLETRVGLASASAGDLAFSHVDLQGRGEAQGGSAGFGLSWRGAARSRAGTSAAAARRLAAGLAAVSPDPPALTRALETARVEAPSLWIDALNDRVEVGLGAPIRLTGQGASVLIEPRRGQAILASRGGRARGALTLVTSGPALPKLTLDLPAYRLGPAGLSADARFEVDDLNIGPLRGARIVAAGRIGPAGRGMAFVSTQCATVVADSFVGEDGPLATGVHARLCPTARRELASFTPSGYAAHTRVAEAGARFPAAEVEIADLSGTVDLVGSGAAMRAGEVQVSSARVLDRAAQLRFRPVSAKGGVALQGDAWIGRFAILDAKARELGQIGVTHAMATGQGAAEIDATRLLFQKGGLQPGDITPMAADALRDASGPASFSGRIGWSRAGITTTGRMSTTGLDFRSALGPVQGLEGSVVFTSLAPLATEPEQSLTVRHVDWLVPLDDARLTLTLTPAEMKVTRAEVGMGGGRVLLDPLDLKLGALLPTSGTLRLTAIDTEKLLAPFNLADKIQLQSRIDGVLPFAFTPEGLRFADGHVFATGPGRLSIKREALTGVSADGAAEATPNAMQSFAYQAMENLAFDQLDARIASQPKGRLGVLFHIKGRHDPPVARKAKVSIFDLLKGRAFEKDIPLPKGTPVDLTLDTSLNFDELMAAYSNAGRSSPIQP